MKKLFITLFFITMILTTPAYANGGIPLWGLTTAHMLAMPLLCIILPFLFPALFLIVSGIEAFVLKIFFKELKFIKVLKLTAIANLITTLIGAIFVWIPEIINNLFPSIFEKFATVDDITMQWFSHWAFWGAYSLFLSNIILFVLSYYVEYRYIKNKLKNEYDIKLINKAVLIANITTYFIPLLIYGIACIYQFYSLDVNF